MKKVLAFILSFVMILSMAACGVQDQTNNDTNQTNSSNSSGSNEANKPADDVKQVYLISVMAGGAAWGACEKGFNDALAELGWEGHFLAPQEANDLAEMVTLTETALTNGADIILGAFNDDNMFSDVIARCTEAGVPVISLWSSPDGIDCSIGTDTKKFGEKMAEAVVKAAGDGPINLVYLQTMLTHQAQNVQYASLRDTLLAERPDAVIYGQEECNSDNAKAADKLSAIKLANPAFNVCVNADGNGTIGCAAFVEDQGLQDEFISVGIDDAVETLRAIKEGNLTCTITQGFYDGGYRAVYIGKSLLEGKTVGDGDGQIPYHTPTENEILFAEDIDEYCKSMGIDLG